MFLKINGLWGWGMGVSWSVIILVCLAGGVGEGFSFIIFVSLFSDMFRVIVFHDGNGRCLVLLRTDTS